MAGCGWSAGGSVWVEPGWQGVSVYAHMFDYCCVMCYDCKGTGCQVGGMSLTLSPPPGCTDLSWHAENASAHCLFYSARVCVCACVGGNGCVMYTVSSFGD